MGRGGSTGILDRQCYRIEQYSISKTRRLLCVGLSLAALALLVGANFLDLLPDAAYWTKLNIAPAVASLIGLNLIFVVFVAFSPSGGLVIGGQDAKPSIKTGAWLALLFSAGVGSGIPMWLFAEPQSYLSMIGQIDFPATPGIEPEVTALRLSFFHWGLNAWAIYLFMALATAKLAASRSGFRAALDDALGNRFGWSTDLAVIIKIVATLIGFAVSVGFALLMIDAAFLSVAQSPIVDSNASFLSAQQGQLKVYLLAATIVAVGWLASRSSGRVCRVVSRAVIGVLTLLLFTLLLVGDTGLVANQTGKAVIEYVKTLAAQSFWLPHDPESRRWQAEWTLFYWAWWLAWAPFMGHFIVKISIGRTIRSLVTAGLIFPSLCAILAFGFGGGNVMDVLGLDAVIAHAMGFAVIEHLFSMDIWALAGIVALAVVAIGFTVVSCAAAISSINETTGSRSKFAAYGWAVALIMMAWILKESGGTGAMKSAIIVAALPLIPVYLILLRGLYQRLHTAQSQPALKTKPLTQTVAICGAK